MGTLLQFGLLGLGSGALYAGLALSVVLTYRGSGMINIAAGSLAVLTAYVYFGLRTGGYLWVVPLGGRWGAGPALLVSLLFALVLGVAFELLVVRPLRRAAPLAKLVATLGVLLTAQSVIMLRFGSTGQIAPPVLASRLVTVLGHPVPLDRLVLTAVVVVATAALVVLYRFTSFGLATRAAAENETTARLAGLSPDRLSLCNTLLASLVAGALGILVAPLSQLDSTTIPLAVVPALGAALLARFTSFTVAAGVGLAMGVLGSLVTYLQTLAWFPTAGGQPLPGVTDVLFLLVIIAGTFWRGRLPGRGTLVENRLPEAPAAARRWTPALVAAVLVVVASLALPFDFRQAMINSLIGVSLCLAYVVLTGFAGQMSIAQVALAGVAAFAVQKAALGLGWGFPLGPVLGIAAATAVGVVIALSSLRVRGVNLAIVTLAAAVAIASFGFGNVVWGGGVTGSPVPEPVFLGLDVGPGAAFAGGRFGAPSPSFAMLCGLVAIVFGLLVSGVRRSEAGQRMLAVRSNEKAAASVGIRVTSVKLAACALSAAMAGTAGCLYAYDFGSVTSDRFGLVIALTFVAFAYVGGITTVTGAVIGGLGVTEGLLGHALNVWFGIPVGYQLLVGGLLLVVTVVQNPAGIAGMLLGERSPLRRMRRPRPPQQAAPAARSDLAGARS